ncbi:peptide ABC transporter substrate-binding protein [Tissierella carlieri]|uniref:Peptide ABC transporter substrate-binding protein n=1 Tax=Tissierella carlieri TaxID=689904 RepID=A0ABT1SBK9_9FIRM|nr:peptide ABC transporter substrate-binding protein [Tissierella carlieri]MCQ4923700.1 peptide ABC transporter substrate-binding protein [Tissierella carlieri]
MKNKKYLCLILMILITVTAVGCAQNELNVGNGDIAEDTKISIEYDPVEGGQVVVPLTNFNTLNPLMTENSSYYFFSKLIFEGLFEFDNDLNVASQLAESYNILDEGRTIEIKLKDNIFWHDGEKFKPEDVVFTVNTIKYASADSTYRQMFSNAMGSTSTLDIKRIMDVAITGSNDIVITFDRAFSNNLEVLTFPIIPKHAFTSGKSGNSDYIKALQLDDYKPIGTGPFKFQTYEKMKEIRLSANDNYRGGRPYIDEILGRVLESEEDILTAFETGQINIATTVGVDWDKYSQNSRIKALEFVSSNYEFLGFNFGKELFSGEKGEGLRRAIAYGIDRQAIIQKLYLGHGTQIDVPIHPDSWLLSEKANTFGYNSDLAKEELKKLGWKDTNNDGILEDESGKSLSLKILTNSYNLMRLKTAEMIKDDLKKLGIDASIYPENKKEEDITVEDIQGQWTEVNQLLGAGDYDMALLGWQLSVIPDLSFAFHSSQIPYNTNFIKYSNPNMDELLQNVFLKSSRDEKVKAYDELQSFIVEDLPYISLFFKNKALLVDSKIVGELNPAFFNPYKGIERCYIPKDLQ